MVNSPVDRYEHQETPFGELSNVRDMVELSYEATPINPALDIDARATGIGQNAIDHSQYVGEARLTSTEDGSNIETYVGTNDLMIIGNNLKAARLNRIGIGDRNGNFGLPADAENQQKVA